MASGTIIVHTESVDYPDYHRSDVWITNTIAWTVTGNTISFALSATNTNDNTWGVCTTGSGKLFMEAQVSYDNGASWVTVSSAQMNRAVCPSTTNVVNASSTLISQLQPATLSGNCQLRFLYYADLTPNPTQSLPHAFPNSSYSAAVQVPVVVTIDYRPGEVLTNNAWKSTNRSGGECKLLLAGTWVTMTTSDAGSTGNPPSIRRNDSWQNQALIGNQT